MIQILRNREARRVRTMKEFLKEFIKGFFEKPFFDKWWWWGCFFGLCIGIYRNFDRIMNYF